MAIEEIRTRYAENDRDDGFSFGNQTIGFKNDNGFRRCARLTFRKKRTSGPQGRGFARSTDSPTCAEPGRSGCLNTNALRAGIVAGAAKLGRLEDAAHVPGLYRVSAAVGHLHAAAVAQLQQGAHHQVHVVPDVARVPDAVAANGGHHTVLQGGPAKSVPVLVRVAAFGEYGRPTRVQRRFR